MIEPSYHTSATYAARTARVIPSGSLTRSKAPGRFFPVGQGPLYADRGHGAYLIDADGNTFIDMLCALGAISLGYGVTGLAARRAIQDGWIYSLPSTLEAQAAEAVLTHVAPWAERCRFTKTGSEATHAAYRIAKQATGRPVVLILEGSYHGWHEWSWRGPDGVPESDSTAVMPYGADLGAWLNAQVYDPSEMAALIWEPHRWELTDREWLRQTRAYCRQHGIVFVTDEMIYGGRWALGGASEFFGVEPDLACFGKAIGNGAPIACVVGSADLLETHGGMVSGTYSGDTAALAALIETLGYYEQHPVVPTLWARGEQLWVGLREAVTASPDLGAVVEGAGAVHQRLRFPEPAQGQRFAAQMAARGVLWHPEVVNVGWSHTSAIIETVIAAAGASLAEMAQEEAA